MADGQGRRRHRQRRKKPIRRCRKIRQPREDIISSMPDDILHQIFSFIPTIWAIRTSVLSKRWSHLWRQTTSLYIEDLPPTALEINQTLTYFTAPKIMSFHLRLSRNHTALDIDSWIKFAMSRNVQNLSVAFDHQETRYIFPKFFYLSASIKQLSVKLIDKEMLPTCTVSWKHLTNLSLRTCKLRVNSIEKILSGCPNLESLALYQCHLPRRLDLSKSLSLKRLEIDRSYWNTGPSEIVAPQIHYLKLKIFEKPFTLVDVSSLTEADLNIRVKMKYYEKADYPHSMVTGLLAKFPNVERLVVGVTVLQVLSLAELCGVPFGVLKVQTLIVKTKFVRSVAPGIARLLQNLPQLKKLIVHTMDKDNTMDQHLASYFDEYWSSMYGCFPISYYIVSILDWQLLPSFMEFILRNEKSLETMV
ncbi:unnamed protein product, partial [Thlaspi arvense]